MVNSRVPELAELERLAAQLRVELAEPVDRPEPAFVFDLGDRKGSPVRTFKAIAQNSLLHSDHFQLATQRSHLATLDAYLDAVNNRQLVIVQNTARAMLELNAFLHEIQSRLTEIVLRVDEANWQSLGQSFWGTIVRARLGTSDPQLREKLLASGIAAASLKPFGVTECIKKLATEAGFDDVEARYAALCDAVHHNFGSRVGSFGGLHYGDRGAVGPTEWIATGGDVPVVRYEYPGVPEILDAHIARTAPGMLTDTKASTVWANEMPFSPFTIDMAERFTGHPYGFGTGPT